MRGKTKHDMVRNDNIRDSVLVIPIIEKWGGIDFGGLGMERENL